MGFHREKPFAGALLSLKSRAAARLAGVDRLAGVWADGVSVLVHHRLAGHPAPECTSEIGESCSIALLVWLHECREAGVLTTSANAVAVLGKEVVSR